MELSKKIFELLAAGTSVKFEPSLCENYVIVKTKRAHMYDDSELVVWRHLKQLVSPRLMGFSVIGPDAAMAQVLELMHQLLCAPVKQPAVWESPDP